MFRTGLRAFTVTGTRALATAASRPLALQWAVARPAAAVFAGQSSPIARRFYSPLSADKPAELLDYAKVKKIIDSKNDEYVVVDVREKNEFSEGHIPGAVNIPFNSSPGALGLEAEEFVDTFGFDKPDKEKTLVFYCLAGVRSTSAEQLAATYGYQKRANYKGSYQDWSEHESKN